MKWNPLVPELSVRNLTSSLRFYTDGVGFSVKFTRDDPPFAYLDLDGAQLMLEEDHATSWVTAPAELPRGRGINLQIEVPSVHAAQKRLHSLGIPAFREISESWYQTADAVEGQSEYLVQDPDGYLIRLIEVLSIS
ncbi:VOC family protein [Lysinibacter sp. HNR]|uniref:bleomycin resistance protein n=1 Tax=Lysinibacter sp. HNR TaxID=3031408 RepID=UPI0024350ED6|nr:VOC family protein [Lysinibacter sp. HNR]WGD38393.1 VOC family protein [Lysinibacter sp. HNR]